MRGTTIELLWSHGIVCPLVRRSSRCAWGFYVAWKAGLHQKALFPHSTPERQSLCESHRQRRWLPHWSYDEGERRAGEYRLFSTVQAAILGSKRPVMSVLPLVVFSHLRWDLVYQRPQHLLSRFAHVQPV